MINKLKIALPKGRLANEVFKLLQTAGYTLPSIKNSRKLVYEDPLNPFIYYFVKPSDVVTYVKENVCDIGIVGYDTLLEQNAAVYELLDLNIGQCKMVVASHPSITRSSIETIATKYPNITREYFKSINQKINIVKLNGSVELGPLVGLSDGIVDIYETGSTLKANGLVVLEDVLRLSSRLIANKEAYLRQNNIVKKLLTDLEKVIVNA